jgi:hypothetical protein
VGVLANTHHTPFFKEHGLDPEVQKVIGLAVYSCTTLSLSKTGRAELSRKLRTHPKVKRCAARGVAA